MKSLIFNFIFHMPNQEVQITPQVQPNPNREERFNLFFERVYGRIVNYNLNQDVNQDRNQDENQNVNNEMPDLIDEQGEIVPRVRTQDPNGRANTILLRDLRHRYQGYDFWINRFRQNIENRRVIIPIRAQISEDRERYID